MEEDKRQRYSRLKRMILGSMIGVPVVLFVIVLGIGYYYFTTSIETSTISSLKRIVEDHRQMIDSFLRERTANLEFVIHSNSFQDLVDPEHLYTVFLNLQKESSAFVDLGVFNEEGTHVAYHGPFKLVGRDYGREPWLKEVLKKGPYISDVFLGYRRVPHFIIAVAREQDAMKWVLRATIDTHLFNEMVKKVRIGKTGEAYLINAEGFFQSERRSGGGLMDQDPDISAYPERHEGTRAFIDENPHGEKFLYATTWLGHKDWCLVVRQEKSDAFRALRSASYIICLILVVGISSIIAIAHFLTNRIVKRMERMDRERELLGVQLIRATGLAELGEMAAGFAHEINNPLQIIRSEQALMEAILADMREKGELPVTDDAGELADSMAQIKLQVDRCAQITQAILKFGRKGEPVSREVDLRTFIPEVTQMISKKASVQGIVLKEEISEETPLIQGDPSHIQQVLLNLFNNGMDAVTQKYGSSGGQLTVGARPGADGRVEVWVRDNGCGISHENLNKIFSPFFTTKPVGKGTGLGLSVCYGIVDKMGGSMAVESEMGVGTTFTISLPTAA
ncbi:MAG: ATP-binding protein [Candidatus Desulfacyla sp.]